MRRSVGLISVMSLWSLGTALDLHPDAEWLHFELIPKTELCALCHSVIGHFQEAKRRDPQEFKESLLLSCTLLREHEEIEKCRAGIDDKYLSVLDVKSVSEICVDQKLCKESEKPEVRSVSNETPKRERPIPLNRDDAFNSNNGDFNGYKSFSAAGRADSRVALALGLACTLAMLWTR